MLARAISIPLLIAVIVGFNQDVYSEVISDMYENVDKKYDVNSSKDDDLTNKTSLVINGDKTINLLDFDDNRFNTFSIASIKDMPEVSALHQQKHASVRHMLISPTAIEAELEKEINKRKSVEYYEEMARKYYDNPRLIALVNELRSLGA